MEKHNFTEEELYNIRKNLDICLDYWNKKWEEKILAILWKYKPFIDNCKDIKYCFTHDLQSNQKFYEKEHKEMNIIFNNGTLTIFQVIDKPIILYELYYKYSLVAEREDIEEIMPLIFNALKDDKHLKIDDFCIKFRQVYKSCMVE